jgi:hypothetical protein
MIVVMPGSCASLSSSLRASNACGVCDDGRVPNACHVHASKRQNLCVLSCGVCHSESSSARSSAAVLAAIASSDSKLRTVGSERAACTSATASAADAMTINLTAPVAFASGVSAMQTPR